jgi:hypothetical protein
MLDSLIANSDVVVSVCVALLALALLYSLNTLPSGFRLICSLLALTIMIANARTMSHMTELQESNARMLNILTGSREVHIPRNQAILNEVCRMKAGVNP